MKVSARINALLVMLGSLVALLCFPWLPFAMNPIYWRMDNALSLMEGDGTRLTRYMQVPAPMRDTSFTAFIVSYGSMWAIPVISLLIVVLALAWLFRRRAAPLLPLLCSILSIVMLVVTLLSLDEFFVLDPGILKYIFTPSPSAGPLVGPGWWVCLIGALLALIAGILGSVASLRRSHPEMA